MSAAIAAVVLLLVLPGAAGAASADPANFDFGNVPLKPTVSHDFTVTVDAGYRIDLASGSGLNVPFAFDFDTCGAAEGTGPGTCNVKESYTPTAAGPASATTNVF